MINGITSVKRDTSSWMKSLLTFVKSSKEGRINWNRTKYIQNKLIMGCRLKTPKQKRSQKIVIKWKLRRMWQKMNRNKWKKLRKIKKNDKKRMKKHLKMEIMEVNMRCRKRMMASQANKKWKNLKNSRRRNMRAGTKMERRMRMIRIRMPKMKALKKIILQKKIRWKKKMMIRDNTLIWMSSTPKIFSLMTKKLKTLQLLKN